MVLALFMGSHDASAEIYWEFNNYSFPVPYSGRKFPSAEAACKYGIDHFVQERLKLTPPSAAAPPDMTFLSSVIFSVGNSLHYPSPDPSSPTQTGELFSATS
jgi:hypothetical protein